MFLFFQSLSLNKTDLASCCCVFSGDLATGCGFIVYCRSRTIWRTVSSLSSCAPIRSSGKYTVVFFIYICSSVRRNSMLKKSNKMPQYADIYVLINYCTCFERPSRPSSRVHKTFVAASGSTDNTICGASFLKRDQIIWSRLQKLAPQIV